MAVGLYWLLLRLGVHRIVAAVGVSPVLLDAYLVNLEQHIIAEALFQSFVIGAVILLLWRERVSVWACGLAGLLLTLGSLTRFVTFGVIPFALLFSPCKESGLASIWSNGDGDGAPSGCLRGVEQRNHREFTITD
jgi:4-amino-4-deoxy-L-arabinose transferase-like glycosyltransferase